MSDEHLPGLDNTTSKNSPKPPKTGNQGILLSETPSGYIKCLYIQNLETKETESDMVGINT
jgi:hypothetical protein